FTLASALVALPLAAPALLLAAEPTPAPAPTPEPTIVLKAARLFDGTSDRLVTPGLVVVTGGKITAVGSDATVPAGARVVDLGDATLLPGLIDAHVHLTQEMTDNWYR